MRQVPTRKFPTKFPGWDLSHSSKFEILVGILQIPQNIQKWESVLFSCKLNWLLLQQGCWIWVPPLTQQGYVFLLLYIYFFTFNSKRNLYGLKNTQILTRFEYPIWGTIRNLQFWGTRRPSSSFPVNGLSENNKNPLQEMKRKNYSPVSMSLQVKRVPSAVAFYGVTTVRAWHNICYQTATRLRSFDFRFQLPSSRRFKLRDTKWQDLQSLLLSPFTACGVSYLKVRRNNNQSF